jgi:DNA-binding NtrC family response regulator
VTGEAGSGRERVARRIHAAGRSPDGPFVEVPCGALDAATAARVLFGEPPEGGRLKLAAGGTLFIESAERLAAELQRRVAEQLRDATFRVIASAGAEPQGFDPDLLRAVDVLRIRVPPLGERREDIEPLAVRAMGRLAREYSRPPKRLAAPALAVLRSYAWPGNLRELENLMERLLLFAPGETIDVRDLPEGLGGTRPPVEDLYRPFGSLAEGRRAFERYFIARVVAEEPNDREAAARRLGIGREELEARLGDPSP